jgi:sporulation protein YlmC with PRC-barrel domain
MVRVELDMKVHALDGEEVGTLQRAVVDPDTNAITYFVVSTGALFGRDILVPREEIDNAAEHEEGALRLRLRREELERLPEYVPDAYAVPPSGWVLPVGYGFPFPGYLWPAGATPRGDETGEAASTTDDVSIARGAVVLDRDGDEVGVVDEVVYDPHGGRVERFVLRVGGPLRTLFGGGDTTEVTTAQIERVEEGIVTLRVDKEELISS